MKQLQLAAIFLMSGFILNAQSSVNNAIPEGFSPGSVVMPDKSIQEGYVKNNLKKNGEVIFLSPDGKKIKYNASQISALSVQSDKYIVANNNFYRIVTDGVKIKLLRKASNTSAIQYNGSEPIAVQAGEGGYDDYFIQTVATGKLQLVRKKDFAKVFTSICADCTTLIDDLKTNKIGFTEIEQAVTIYNTCGN